MNIEKIGKLITKKRKEKNYTQKDLAERLNVTDRAVSKWERGIGCPDISLLENLSKILDISIVELLNGEEKENIKEKDILSSIKYVKDDTKNKVLNNINVIITMIIFATLILLIIFNITNYYKLNKKEQDYYSIEFEANNKIKNIDKYINIISNNQGKYNKEDYEKILEYVKTIRSDLNYEVNNKDYSIKTYYNFLQNKKNNYFTKYNGLNKSLYYILIKYDTSIIDNMIKYENYSNQIRNLFSNIESRVINSYKYSFKKEETNPLNSAIYLMYVEEEMLLKDIIEVGDINE